VELWLLVLNQRDIYNRSWLRTIGDLKVLNNLYLRADTLFIRRFYALASLFRAHEKRCWPQGEAADE